MTGAEHGNIKENHSEAVPHCYIVLHCSSGWTAGERRAVCTGGRRAMAARDQKDVIDGVAAAAAEAHRRPWLTSERGTGRGRGRGLPPNNPAGGKTMARLPPVVAHQSPGTQPRPQHTPQQTTPTQAAASPSLTAWGEFPDGRGKGAAREAATLPQEPRQQRREDLVPHCQQRPPLLPPPGTAAGPAGDWGNGGGTVENPAPENLGQRH